MKMARTPDPLRIVPEGSKRPGPANGNVFIRAPEVLGRALGRTVLR